MDDPFTIDRVANGLSKYFTGLSLKELTQGRRDYILALAKEAVRLTYEKPRRKRRR